MATGSLRATAIWLLIVACGSGTDEAPPVPTRTAAPSICETEAWTRRAWLSEGAFGSRRGELAGDFTVPTDQGDWTFSAHFSGCESYVFVPDLLTVSPLDSTPLLDVKKDVRTLIGQSPRNVHWFFVTGESGRAVDSFAERMRGHLDSALDKMDETERAWWSERLHVVTRGQDKLGGWVEDAMTSTGLGFAIDRFQRIRGFGGLADVTRYDAALDSAGAWPWENNLAYIAHEPMYYNVESDRQDMLDAVDWTPIYLHYAEDIANSGHDKVWVELPDAATVASFDTLLVDLTHTCDNGSQEFGNCDAWDAVQAVHICEVDDPEVCDLELARIITTYHREGRWLADASNLLPALATGGRRRMQLRGARFGHFVSVRLLLGHTGKGAVPFAIQELWEGGSWNEDYDATHPPIEVPVPQGATRAYLHVVLSGHGMSAEHNCAEFCDHQHTFSVGGASFTAAHPDMGDQEGCLGQIDQGTVPNQNGTWWYERSSWCPGKQVDPWVWEITDQVAAGQTATIGYRTNYGQPAIGGSIFLRSWVSFWR